MGKRPYRHISRRSKSKKVLGNDFPKATTPHGIFLSSLWGFFVGSALLFCAFLFFYSMIIRILIILAMVTYRIISGNKPLRKLKSSLKSFPERHQVLAELYSHFEEQLDEWKSEDASNQVLMFRLIVMMLEMSWAAFAMKFEESLGGRFRSR